MKSTKTVAGLRWCRVVSAEKNGGKNRSVRGRRIDEERKMATPEEEDRENQRRREKRGFLRRKGMKKQPKGGGGCWLERVTWSKVSIGGIKKKRRGKRKRKREKKGRREKN